KTVIFSSHILQEVEAICDQVVIINKGKLVANSSVKELLKLHDTACIQVRFNAPADFASLGAVVGVSALYEQADGSVLVNYTMGSAIQEGLMQYATAK